MKFILALIVALTCATTFAKQSDYKWNAGVGLGATIPTGDSTFNNAASSGFTGGADLNYFFTKNFGAGLSYDYLDFGKIPSSISAFNLNGIYRFDESTWTPFVQLGAGMAAVDPGNSGSNYSVFGWKVGAGVNYKINEQLAAVGQLNYHSIMKDNPSHPSAVQSLNPVLGIRYYFGTKNSSQEEKNANNDDESTKDEVGSTQEVDSIEDCDEEDESKCVQKAAATVANTPVVASNVPTEMNLKLIFPPYKAQILPEHKEELNKLAEVLKKNPNLKTEIQGHTDNSGNKEQNERISQQRAESVRLYLIKKLGVDAQRVSAKGYGDSNPLADNSTAEGRVQNRRVVASFSN